MMTNEQWQELAQEHELAYFRADVCLGSPQSYSLEEKRQICEDMDASTKAVDAAMRANFWSLHAEERGRLFDMLCQSGVESPEWWWGVLVGEGDPLYKELETL